MCRDTDVENSEARTPFFPFSLPFPLLYFSAARGRKAEGPTPADPTDLNVIAGSSSFFFLFPLLFLRSW